jgi:hypothetical protein
MQKEWDQQQPEELPAATAILLNAADGYMLAGDNSVYSMLPPVVIPIVEKCYN